MWWSDRRGFLALAGGGALVGCGFQPMREKGSAASSLYGRILLPEATSPVEFAYRERMRRRFGDGGAAAPLRLDSVLEIEETGVAITQASDITRYRLVGRARWRLVDVGDGVVALEDEVTSTTGFDATASAFAARAARNAARERLAVELAELTAARLGARADAIAGGA